MTKKPYAHLHEYAPKVNSFEELIHVCQICNFHIPDNLLKAAVAGGAKVVVPSP